MFGYRKMLKEIKTDIRLTTIALYCLKQDLEKKDTELRVLQLDNHILRNELVKYREKEKNQKRPEV